MKLFKATAATLSIVGALALGACSSDETADTGTTTSAAEATADDATTGVTEYPTAEELNEILAVATDPNASIEEKINTVHGS
ncbi:MAG: hypothetical protein GX983_00295, partial [Corynebacterium sp.]|nr:hypothetical protein [Corynebacterium sp.]